MQKRIPLFLLITSLLFSPLLARANYLDRPAAKQLIDELVKNDGLNRARLTKLLADAKRKDSILEAIARPAEKTLNWGQYRRIFVQSSRIRQGLTFYSKHRDVLKRAEKQYGVPAEIILGILGVETRYGRHKGNYRVLDALATLGFDYPPRAAFFRKQLKALFRMEKTAGINADKITGSYAGAMGYPQFIPSSYLAYAVDFDGDGKIDLVNSAADAIGSVANYFKVHGWKPGLPVAARARVTGDKWHDSFGRDLEADTTLGQLQKLGATPLSCHNDDLPNPYCFDLPKDTRVIPLKLEGSEGTEFWLATHNFYVISRYNHSPLYAMAVYQLSRELKSRLDKK